MEDRAYVSTPVPLLGRLRVIELVPFSGSTSISPPFGVERGRGLNPLRLMVGDGGREVAGEKTPTPDSFSLEKMETSSLESSARPFWVSSEVREGGEGEDVLESEVGAKLGEEEEAEESSMMILGVVPG